MPAEYEKCLASEMTAGKDKKTAQRICAAAYYKRHGKTVEQAAGEVHSMEDELELHTTDVETFDKSTGAIDEYSAQCAEFAGDPTHGLEPWIEKPCKVFTHGQHKPNGRNYTLSDLHAMATHSRRPEGDAGGAPLTLNHTKDPKAIIGRARDYWVAGDWLWSLGRFIGDDAVKAVKNRRWVDLSVGVDVSGRFPKIDHIAVVTSPQVEGAAIHSKQGGSTMADEKDPKEKDPKEKPGKKAPEKEPDPKGPEEEEEDEPGDGEGEGKGKDGKKKPTTKKPEKSDTYSANDQISALREEFAKKMDAQKLEVYSRVEILEKENAELKKVQTFAKLAEKIETYSKDGVSYPQSAPQELDLLEAISDKDNHTSEEILDLYDKMKKATPKVALLQRHGRSYIELPADKAETENHAKNEGEKERLSAQYASKMVRKSQVAAAGAAK